MPWCVVILCRSLRQLYLRAALVSMENGSSVGSSSDEAASEGSNSDEAASVDGNSDGEQSTSAEDDEEDEESEESEEDESAPVCGVGALRLRVYKADSLINAENSVYVTATLLPRRPSIYRTETARTGGSGIAKVNGAALCCICAIVTERLYGVSCLRSGTPCSA